MTGTVSRRPSRRLTLAAAALWLLPFYAVLLTLTTLTHEPDHTVDFAAWSRFVTTDRFLVSHLGGSILGAGLGLVGVVAALLFLVRGRAKVAAMSGAGLTILANTLFTAMFGIAAFTQPAIGRAFLAGDTGMRDFYDEVYGGPLFLVFGVGALAFLAGAVTFGVAVARTAPELRWAGYGYAAALAGFLVLGFTFSILQPLAGAVVALAAGYLALRLPGTVRQSVADRPAAESLT